MVTGEHLGAVALEVQWAPGLGWPNAVRVEVECGECLATSWIHSTAGAAPRTHRLACGHNALVPTVRHALEGL